MEQTEDQMNMIMGIGPKVQLSESITKTLRVATIKQLKDVSELQKAEGLFRIKFGAQHKDSELQISRWVEIIDLIFIEGFTREEFENSIPELMESAVDRFLFN